MDEGFTSWTTSTVYDSDMKNFSTFTSSHSQNTIQFLIISLVILPWKHVSSYLLSCLFWFKFNVMKENMIFTLLTSNKTLYIYSRKTLSYYIPWYFNFSSGAPPPHLLALPSRPFSLTSYSTLISIYWLCILHHPMQRQKCIPDTHFDRRVGLELEMSWNFHFSVHNLLCDSEIDNNLLNYSDASSLSPHQISRVWASPFHFLSWRHFPFPSQ